MWVWERQREREREREKDFWETLFSILIGNHLLSFEASRLGTLWVKKELAAKVLTSGTFCDAHGIFDSEPVNRKPTKDDVSYWLKKMCLTLSHNSTFDSRRTPLMRCSEAFFSWTLRNYYFHLSLAWRSSHQGDLEKMCWLIAFKIWKLLSKTNKISYFWSESFYYI